MGKIGNMMPSNTRPGNNLLITDTLKCENLPELTEIQHPISAYQQSCGIDIEVGQSQIIESYGPQLLNLSGPKGSYFFMSIRDANYWQKIATKGLMEMNNHVTENRYVNENEVNTKCSFNDKGRIIER